MTLESLKSAHDLSIDELGMEIIRSKLTDLKRMLPYNILDRAKKPEETYQNNRIPINKLVLDIFETPENFFEGTGINPLYAFGRDIYLTRVAISEYLMEMGKKHKKKVD